MKHFLFAFYDVKLEQFLPPWSAPNRNMAFRAVTQMLKSEDTQLKQFPGDFNLYMIGEFEFSTGQLSSMPIENLGFISQFLES